MLLNRSVGGPSSTERLSSVLSCFAARTMQGATKVYHVYMGNRVRRVQSLPNDVLGSKLHDP